MVYPSQKGPGPGSVVELDIPADADLGRVASLLHGRGLIRKPMIWASYARVIGASGRIRPGLVRLHDSASPADVLRAIAEGFGSSFVRVTIPEGYNRFEIGARLEEWGICSKADFVEGTEDPTVLSHHNIEGESLEGYLFPDTYQFARGSGPRRVAIRMVENWRRKMMPLFDEHAERLARYRSQHGMSTRDVLTLASVIEEEAGVPSERKRIAGVFVNRLSSETFRPKHRLQSDPTVSYGCLAKPELTTSCAGFNGRITRAMLQDTANPYNTYRHAGVPPGPITNPGLASMRAALAPEDHDLIYFVVKGGGRHEFSETFEAHQEAVRRYRRRQRE